MRKLVMLALVMLLLTALALPAGAATSSRTRVGVSVDYEESKNFTDDEVRVIRDYYRERPRETIVYREYRQRHHDDDDDGCDLPPGLAKKGKVPPGWAKKRRKHHDHDDVVEERRVVREYRCLPEDLEERLPRRSGSVVRIHVGGDIILKDVRTGRFLDVIPGVD